MNGEDCVVGIDIGGTFTDFVLWERGTHRFEIHKVLTTQEAPSRGVIEGLEELLEMAQVSANDLSLCIHGTTLVANALIERRGAKTALLATSGHTDVLEIGTEIRYDAYNLKLVPPEPLVPRTLRFPVAERVGRDGHEVRPLNLADLALVAEELERAGVESVGVCFLHSFRGPEHEAQARSFLQSSLHNVDITVSSEVAPEIREYPRMSTTVANAYVKPLVREYLGDLIERLRSLGYRRPLFLLLSSGGVSTAEIAQEYPIQIVESGPSGGALLAARIGGQMKRSDVLSFDMGGTTAKLTYVIEGRVTTARSFEVARVDRFQLGSGLPIQVPVVDMIEVGAGGGSIAYVDPLGLLKVGPRSAGASPGPACYGNGGTKPTVTDADLLLGYLAPQSFLGGRMHLDRDLAVTAVEGEVGRPLGMSAVDAAAGMFRVVTEGMVSAARVHVAEKARDPRKACLVAFGGAGPIHAFAIARALKVSEVLCPARAGTASAIGFLSAPIAFHLSRSLPVRLSELRFEELGQVYKAMEEQGRTTLLQAGVIMQDVRFERSIDMKYVGQGHELEVSLPSGRVDQAYVDSLVEWFDQEYLRRYGRVQDGAALELTTCRLIASGPDPNLQFGHLEIDGDPRPDARKGDRQVYFEEAGGFVNTIVYDRYHLAPGAVLEGPAVVEEWESTAIIPPSMVGTIDDIGNLVINWRRDS